MWYLKVWGFQGSLFWTKKVQGVKYGGLCVSDPPAKNTDLEALCTGLLSSVRAQCTVAQPAYQKRPILGSVKIPGTTHWPHPPTSHPSWGRQKGVQWHKGARKPVQCIQNYSIGSDKGRQKCVSNVQTKDLRPRHKEDSVSSSGLRAGKTMPRWLPSISYSSIQTTSSTDSSLMTLTRWKCLWFVFKFTSRRWLSDSVSSSVECMGFMYLVCIWYVFWNLIRMEWVSARISGDLMTNLYWLLIQEPSRQRL